MAEIVVKEKRAGYLRWEVRYANGNSREYRWTRGRRFGDGSYKPNYVYQDVGNMWKRVPTAYFSKQSDVLKWAKPVKKKQQMF